jgi:hypothetical protein
MPGGACPGWYQPPSAALAAEAPEQSRGKARRFFPSQDAKLSYYLLPNAFETLASSVYRWIRKFPDLNKLE